MFLHIGENITILKKDIVVIIDKENIDNSEDNKKLINNMIKNNCLYNKDNHNTRTYIITCINKMDRKNRVFKKKYTLYTSNISSTTLSSRGYIDI